MGQDGGPTPARQGDGALYRRLLRLARPYAPHLGALLLLELVDGLCVLLRPVPIKLAIDSVVGSRPLPPSLGWVMPRSVSASPGTLLAVALGLLLAVALLLVVFLPADAEPSQRRARRRGPDLR